MHLSPLPDTATPSGPAAISSAGLAEQSHSSMRCRPYRDRLIRALLFAAALSLPLALAIATGSTGLHDPSAGYALAFDTPR